MENYPWIAAEWMDFDLLIAIQKLVEAQFVIFNCFDLHSAYLGLVSAY